MMRDRSCLSWALCGAIILAGAATPPGATAQTAASSRAAADEPGLVGTWKPVRYTNTAKDGKVTYPFGEHPFGYFVYDPTGHLSVQLMHNPPIGTQTASPPVSGDQPEERAFTAYFGTYRIDKARQVLHHMVEGALDPEYVANPDQVRPYRLSGDTLIIELTDQKTGTRYYRELRRVR